MYSDSQLSDQVWSGVSRDLGPMNTMKGRISPGQRGRHFAGDIFRCISLNDEYCIVIKMSLEFVPDGPIDNKPALISIMAWCRTGVRP